MPDDKVETIRQLKEERRVAMVGDGVNDAPATANTTVGIVVNALRLLELRMPASENDVGGDVADGEPSSSPTKTSISNVKVKKLILLSKGAPVATFAFNKTIKHRALQMQFN